ncbi:hypothetical protein B0H63DRAFT_389980 [Podospora didyma]|uniref:Rhodopsin domain-containing protein n=1 Tax=Podospora didyma TaxID=330526 RepID=A0AAE0U376_9PEZI|nr:hypothetical protein B0H63DRAFT_389980 [Podospora didyma]
MDQLPPGNAPRLPYNSLQHGTVVAFGITYFFCTVVLALRYFQAIKLVKRVEVDLVILTLSYGAALVYFVTMLNLMANGWGRHMVELNMTDLIEFSKGLLPNTLTYLIIPAVTKLAMLCVLFKINPSIYYRAGVVAVGISIFAYTLTLTSITGGPCNPMKENTLKCLENVALAQAALNIVSDLAVVVLPLPTVFSLQFSMKQKISVSCILAIGSSVVICSIARLPYVIQLGETTADSTYTEAILGVWSIVEVNLGIFCGCSMRLKPLIVRYLPQLGLFSSRNTSGHNNIKSHGSWGTSKELRTDPRKAQHTYQLHSVQKGSSDPLSSFESPLGASTLRGAGTSTGPIQVHRGGDGLRSDGDSTDTILT